MEVFASILALQFFVALGGAIEKLVACDWNVPEHKDVRADQNYPVHDELAFLLMGYP